MARVPLAGTSWVPGQHETRQQLLEFLRSFERQKSANVAATLESTYGTGSCYNATQDLAQVAKDRGIRYFMISYTDLFGGQRAKLVPAAAIADMQRDGAGFAGFATWLDMTPAHPDLFAMPDASALIQLPWKKDVAWVAADCVMDDKHVQQAPRIVLKNVLAKAAAAGPLRQDRRRVRVLPHQRRRHRHLRHQG